MDTSLLIRPAVGVTDVGVARPDPVPVQQAVQTELPAAKTVTASANAGAAQRATQSPENLSRQLIIDPQTREVIYRVTDVRTQQVLWQVPDGAMVRAQTYARTAEAAQKAPQAETRTDIKA